MEIDYGIYTFVEFVSKKSQIVHQKMLITMKEEFADRAFHDLYGSHIRLGHPPASTLLSYWDSLWRERNDGYPRPFSPKTDDDIKGKRTSSS